MKAKTHSILAVVNAHADVERSLSERSEVHDDLQSRGNVFGHLPARLPNRIANFYSKRSGNIQKASKTASWGILFGSEYLWAPDIGPILIVVPTKGTNHSNSNTSSSSPTIINCCILQFENQLSTQSSLRIFHGY